jgi:U6 snRNA-associated Sm-like protein LSm8
LTGFDQTTNIILSASKERIFSMEGTQDLELGLYLIRGDSVVAVSLVDRSRDEEIDWEKLKANPLKALNMTLI